MIASFFTLEAVTKIPNHYLKVQIFTYIDENLAIVFILQTTFQSQDTKEIDSWAAESGWFISC